MKYDMRSIAAAAILSLPLSAQAFITGDVTGGGNFTGTVTSNDAWAESNPIDGESVNFWTLSGNAGDKVSILVESAELNFGLSLYKGLIEPFELLVPGFDNAASFADNEFIAGTPIFAPPSAELVDILLPETGIYTLAVGGESPFTFGDSFDYDMTVSITPVPLPAAVWLLGSALLASATIRRRG